MLWFITITSPHGAFCMGMLNLGDVCNGHEGNCIVPPFWSQAMIMAVESCLYLLATYRIDRRNFLPVAPQPPPPMDPSVAAAMDDDVKGEREDVLAMTLEEISPQAFQDGTYNQAALHNSLEEGRSGSVGSGNNRFAAPSPASSASTSSSGSSPLAVACSAATVTAGAVLRAIGSRMMPESSISSSRACSAARKRKSSLVRTIGAS